MQQDPNHPMHAVWQQQTQQQQQQQSQSQQQQQQQAAPQHPLSFAGAFPQQPQQHLFNQFAQQNDAQYAQQHQVAAAAAAARMMMQQQHGGGGAAPFQHPLPPLPLPLPLQQPGLLNASGEFVPLFHPLPMPDGSYAFSAAAMSLSLNGGRGAQHEFPQQQQQQQAMAEETNTPEPQQLCCHQCKTVKAEHLFHLCRSAQTASTSSSRSRKSCRKKYCEPCLRRLYRFPTQPDTPESRETWICPSCEGRCSCAACQRRRVDQNGSPTPLSATPRAGSSSESSPSLHAQGRPLPPAVHSQRNSSWASTSRASTSRSRDDSPSSPRTVAPASGSSAEQSLSSSPYIVSQSMAAKVPPVSLSSAAELAVQSSTPTREGSRPASPRHHPYTGSSGGGSPRRQKRGSGSVNSGDSSTSSSPVQRFSNLSLVNPMAAAGVSGMDLGPAALASGSPLAAVSPPSAVTSVTSPPAAGNGKDNSTYKPSRRRHSTRPPSAQRPDTTGASPGASGSGSSFAFPPMVEGRMQVPSAVAAGGWANHGQQTNAHSARAAAAAASARNYSTLSSLQQQQQQQHQLLITQLAARSGGRWTEQQLAGMDPATLVHFAQAGLGLDPNQLQSQGGNMQWNQAGQQGSMHPLQLEQAARSSRAGSFSHLPPGPLRSQALLDRPSSDGAPPDSDQLRRNCAALEADLAALRAHQDGLAREEHMLMLQQQMAVAQEQLMHLQRQRDAQVRIIAEQQAQIHEDHRRFHAEQQQMQQIRAAADTAMQAAGGAAAAAASGGASDDAQKLLLLEQLTAQLDQLRRMKAMNEQSREQQQREGQQQAEERGHLEQQYAQLQQQQQQDRERNSQGGDSQGDVSVKSEPMEDGGAVKSEPAAHGDFRFSQPHLDPLDLPMPPHSPDRGENLQPPTSDPPSPRATEDQAMSLAEPAYASLNGALFSTSPNIGAVNSGMAGHHMLERRGSHQVGLGGFEASYDFNLHAAPSAGMLPSDHHH